MCTPVELRQIVRENLGAIRLAMNSALLGEGLDTMEATLQRVGRGGRLPHWYAELARNGTVPNADGKTVGSVVEMLLVGVLENSDLPFDPFPPQEVNPASGVDLPGLELGVKSPSTNWDTSEPFFSAYERLLGSEYDVLVLLTDYQTAKETSPLKLQITDASYLTKSEIADETLCTLARSNREWLLTVNESWAKKFFRFLAYVNKTGDWRARHLLGLARAVQEPDKVRRLIAAARDDFRVKNARAERRGTGGIPEEEITAIEIVATIEPLHLGVIDALDNWVLETHGEAARAPSVSEWRALKRSELDGKITMSFALQWRYSFRKLFRRA
jgi:hypothetical protein